jgi:hypothetical protein
VNAPVFTSQPRNVLPNGLPLPGGASESPPHEDDIYTASAHDIITAISRVSERRMLCEVSKQEAEAERDAAQAEAERLRAELARYQPDGWRLGLPDGSHPPPPPMSDDGRTPTPPDGRRDALPQGQGMSRRAGGRKARHEKQTICTVGRPGAGNGGRSWRHCTGDAGIPQW